MKPELRSNSFLLLRTAKQPNARHQEPEDFADSLRKIQHFCLSFNKSRRCNGSYVNDEVVTTVEILDKQVIGIIFSSTEQK
jgi:hypothetical protein